MEQLPRLQGEPTGRGPSTQRLFPLFADGLLEESLRYRTEPPCIAQMVPVKYEVGRAEPHEGKDAWWAVEKTELKNSFESTVIAGTPSLNTFCFKPLATTQFFATATASLCLDLFFVLG